MIELNRHIEVLLLSNDCVIVPDLGGFMAHHVEARYDSEDGIFLPPLRTLGFNPQLKLNDSLLAQSYIEAYDISYPEAVHRIEDEVNELKQHLYNEGKYELNDIGLLSLNSEGHYVFEPCEAGVLTPELYGLCGFEMSPLKAGVTDQPARMKVVDSSREESSVPYTDGGQTVLKPTGENPKLICLHESTLRKIAAIFIGILVVLSFTIPIGNNDSGNVLKSNIDTGILYKALPKSITTGKVPVKPASSDTNSSQNVQAKEAVEKPTSAADVSNGISEAEDNTTDTPTINEAPKAAAENDAEGPYCIVLASKVSMKNAGIFVDQLHQGGFGSARIFTRNKVNRVIYGDYQSEQEAYHALNQLREHDEFAEGWVMKIN